MATSGADFTLAFRALMAVDLAATESDACERALERLMPVLVRPRRRQRGPALCVSRARLAAEAAFVSEIEKHLM